MEGGYSSCSFSFSGALSSICMQHCKLKLSPKLPRVSGIKIKEPQVLRYIYLT